MITYREWVHWLETRSPMPLIKPGLEKTRSALLEADLFKNISSKKVIVIAGTNGKGTTAKTLEQLLLASGQTVGLYTSPHLVDTTERIRINGKDISQNEFTELCVHYKPLIEKWDLTHFESLTLFAAHSFFKKESLDWAIFEVGLGGTWDATNVIPHDTSVITSLGFDHMHILGNTLEEIALNKFGIIQKNNTVLHNHFDPQVTNAYSQRLLEMNAKDILVPSAQFEVQKKERVPTYFLKNKWGLTPLSLPGTRAIQNMNLALHVFEYLGFDPQKYLFVLSQIQWPARMTPLKRESLCPIYLSGDHNLQGIESLVEILEHCRYEKLHILLGVSKNRNPSDYLPTFKKLNNYQVTLTKPQFQGVTPPLEPEDVFYEDSQLALQSILKKAHPEDLIVITGSLYLCGDYLKAL